MSSADPHPVRTGVVATVVGGVALAALAELWPPSKTFFLWAWSGLKSFFSYFGDDYKTPGWALAILGLFALVTVIRFIVGLVPKLAPEYTRYVEQNLYGAQWQWNWVGSEISSLWCLCPTCKAELVYDDSSAHNIYSDEKVHTKFVCENCAGRVVARIDGGDKDYALSAVKREIRRRVRIGAFKSDVPQ